MASLQEIKSRKHSVATTKKITKAMQLVATAKLRRAKSNLDGIQEYYQAIYETFNHIFNSVRDFSKIVPTNVSKKQVYIIITSDIGLCGAYNNNIYKLTKSLIKNSDEMIVIGTKGSLYFKKDARVKNQYERVGDHVNYEIPAQIAKHLSARYLVGEISGIHLIHTQFVNSVSFHAKTTTILPFDQKPNQATTAVLTEFEPDPETVIKNAIPLYISALIYGAMVESKVSEMSSRRIAMENASDNADDLIDKLDLEYNRARQSKITQEISEIIAGSEE